MTIFLLIIIILTISFVLALRSMGDFESPDGLKRLIDLKKLRGSIVFFKNNIRHYRH